MSAAQRWIFQQRIAHERWKARAHVGRQLDALCRAWGLDPVPVWRIPRAAEGGRS